MKSENRNLKIYENLKLLIHIGHYLILLIKKIQIETKNILHCRILVSAIHGKKH